jgi:hypothetical protein
MRELPVEQPGGPTRQGDFLFHAFFRMSVAES